MPLARCATVESDFHKMVLTFHQADIASLHSRQRCIRPFSLMRTCNSYSGDFANAKYMLKRLTSLFRSSIWRLSILKEKPHWLRQRYVASDPNGHPIRHIFRRIIPRNERNAGFRRRGSETHPERRHGAVGQPFVQHGWPGNVTVNFRLVTHPQEFDKRVAKEKSPIFCALARMPVAAAFHEAKLT